MRFNDVVISSKDAIKPVDLKTNRKPAYVIDENQVDGKRRTGVYGISANLEGVYVMNAVRESNGDSGKIINSSPVEVVQCPSASWTWKDAKSKSDLSFDGEPFNICVEESVDITVHATGVLPITLYYLSKVGSGESIELAQSQKGETTDCTKVDSENVAMCKLANSKVGTAVIPIHMKAETSAKYLFQIARLQDGLNNTIEFDTTDTVLPEIFGAGMHVFEGTPGDVISFDVHGQPTVKVSDCSNVRIKTQFDEKVESRPSTAVPLKFTGSPPFSLKVDFVLEEGGSAKHLELNDIQGLGAKVAVNDSGTFSIVSIHDKYCLGIIDSPSSCLISPVYPPSLSISTSPIEEACLGAVGANVEATFSGESPFWIEYVVERAMIGDEKRQVSRNVERKSSILKPRISFQFEPTEPGVYKYTFTKASLYLSRWATRTISTELICKRSQSRKLFIPILLQSFHFSRMVTSELGF